MNERNINAIDEYFGELDRSAMEQLERVVPAVIELESEKHDTGNFPLGIYHREHASRDGNSGMSSHDRAEQDEYFIKFTMDDSQEHPVMNIEAMRPTDRGDITDLDASELSIIYDESGQVAAMTARGELNLADFTDILAGYLKDQTTP